MSSHAGAPVAAARPPRQPALIPPGLPRAFGLASLALAAFAAAVLPGHPAGLGVTLVVIGIVAIAAPTLATLAGRRDPWTLGLWVVVMLLACMATLRDAAWVVALSLVGAAAFASIAAAGGFRRRAGELLVSCFAALWLVVPGPVVVAVACARRASGVAWSRTGGVVRGVGLAGALVLVFGALFAAADEAFAQLVGSVLDVELDRGGERLGVFLLVMGFLGGLVATSHTARTAVRPPTVDLRVDAGSPRRPLGRTEWLIALLALDALFAVFVAVQLTVLFGGQAHVLRTAGLTYADYVHQGFGQLVVATLLVLGVIGAAHRWSAREGRGDELLLRVALWALVVLALVVVASALKRVDGYVDAFGHTRLRFLAASFELYLGVLLVLAAGAVATLRDAAWVPRAVMGLTALFAVGFGAADPDRRVASANVERFVQTGRIDAWYVSQLSDDALPALRELPPGDTREDVFRWRDVRRHGADDGWAAFNLARRR